ncbi:MAG: hypothetical protein QME07_05835 [bacterium]|nr:hypothetical protein [bacterium]
MMRRMGFTGIILFLGLAGNSFSEEAVTNRQILEKLEKIETKMNSVDVRIARVETKVEEGQKSLQRQIDGLKTLVLGGFGVIFAGIFALIGFVLWDRRSALAPAVREMKALEEREGRLEKILREYAQKEPELAAIMRSITL